MREDVRVDEVWFEGPDDDHWEAAARECRQRLRDAEGKLAERFLREIEAFVARLDG
jgi:hypothetical protein